MKQHLSLLRKSSVQSWQIYGRGGHLKSWFCHYFTKETLQTTTFLRQWMHILLLGVWVFICLHLSQKTSSSFLFVFTPVYTSTPAIPIEEPSSSVYPSCRKAFPICSEKLLPYSVEPTLFHVYMWCDKCNYQLFSLLLTLLLFIFWILIGAYAFGEVV